MKKVNHWINGKNVAGNDYFQTTNPATGEVLADVASGGEAEINQAVAAAKEAFPKWANLPMKERARLMRRLGDLIDQNVPEIRRDGNRGHGPADPSDQKCVDPTRFSQL
ncbi:5-carboxymethyl-2-hydroxymuconate semialdehyde dehydrogenase [Escherichia coli]|nr:5-carboxymethyl-2-hydroxymuconate semialdehyde dehydrogenase [Escherichia coli]